MIIIISPYLKDDSQNILIKRVLQLRGLPKHKLRSYTLQELVLYARPV